VRAPARWIQLSNDGIAWGPPMPPGAVSGVPWRLAAGPDGARHVLVRVMDADGRWSASFSAPTVVDRSGPLVTGPALRRVRDRWWISFAQSDLTGFRPVRVRHRAGEGPWSDWRRLRTPGDASVAAPDGVPVTVELEASDRLGNTTLARVSTAPAASPSPGAGAP
jgi:hypothetical protein